MDEQAVFTEHDLAVVRFELLSRADKKPDRKDAHLVGDTTAYARARLSPQAAERQEVKAAVAAALQELVTEGAIEVAGGCTLTDAGRLKMAEAFWRTHMTHVLRAMVEATTLWATPSGEPVVAPAERVAAEYAAFTHQRALLEVLGADDRTSAIDARKVLRLDEQLSVAAAQAAVSIPWVNELNRASSHIGRRFHPADPPPGAGLSTRVAWLTARILDLWRSSPARVVADGDEHAGLTAAITDGEQVATDAGSDLLRRRRRSASAQWDHPTDPFADWHEDARDWPVDPDAAD